MKTYKKMISYSMALLAALTLSGCGKSTVDSKAQINIPIYDKIEYSTSEVVKGDIEPEISLLLRVDDFHSITYTADRDDLEIDKVYVAVGDKVKKGDVMVSFKSGDIEELIEDYQKQLEDDELIIKHYKRLMALEDNESHEQKKDEDTDDSDGISGEEEGQSVEVSDYSDAIAEVEKEMRLIQVKIEEAREKLKSYNLIAEEDGSIVSVDEGLYFGYVTPEVTLISESCGSKDYIATTKDDYNFEIGATFVAESGVAKYDMRLKAVEGTENAGERQLVFEPITDMSGVSKTDTFTIYVKKPVLKDVIYVPAKAVFDVDDKYYVYVMDENGFRDGVEVTVGETVGEPGSQLTVITSGLNGGEQVMSR